MSILTKEEREEWREFTARPNIDLFAHTFNSGEMARALDTIDALEAERALLLLSISVSLEKAKHILEIQKKRNKRNKLGLYF